MNTSEKQSRRTFFKRSSATGLGLGLAPAIVSAKDANDRIRVGFIGVGNRGTQLLHSFMQNRDVEIAALCDVYEPYLLRDKSKVHKRFIDEINSQIPAMGEKFRTEPKRYRDFRQLLDDKDIDAVVIATPDHLHAVQTIAACKAGKDVYVEKPLTATIHEGRKMVEVASRTRRVVQVGLNRRGAKTYQECYKRVHTGEIGDIIAGNAFHISNMYPAGIGNAVPEDPPDGFNWDMWLGPRAARPFQYNIHPYRFRWWKGYSSQMGNWGVHFMDAIRWMMDEAAPVSISAHGGKTFLDDDRTIPDTMHVTFEFASGALVTFSIFEACGGKGIDQGEVELRGTKGTLYINERGYRIEPSRHGQFQTWDRLTEPAELRLEERFDSTAVLVRDFLDCIKTRGTCLCPLEEGHRSTSFAHLANIALETGLRIEWDPVKERITNSDEANSLLHYEYRSPWTLE